jgi:hypothetical protein
MDIFKKYNAFSLDNFKYTEVPSRKHQFELDSLATLNLIKIDEWSVPVYLYPSNSSINTRNELLIMAAEIQQKSAKDQIDYVNKYNDVTSEFKKLCEKEYLIFPETYIDDLLEEATDIIIKLKYKYNRPRPYQLAPMLGISLRFDIKDSAKSPSFPSGHALQGKLAANVLSLMFPELKDKFQKIGANVAYSRYIGAFHFPSDLEYGALLADWLMDHIVLPDQMDETLTIGKRNDLPNVTPNPIQPGEGEDARLLKIRQFKGSFEDYKNYWNDRI